MSDTELNENQLTENPMVDETVSINIDGKDTSFLVSDFPALFEEKASAICQLEEQLKKSDEAAVEAQNAANSLKERKRSCFHRSQNIEDLQESGKKTAEALTPIVDAQKLSFQYQQKLSEMCNFLMALGLYNSAMRNIVIRETKLKLQCASETQISDLYRKELQNVIDQLQAQETTEKQLESIKSKSHEQEDELARQSTKDKEHDERLNSIEKKDGKQDLLLQQCQNRLDQYDKKLRRLTVLSFVCVLIGIAGIIFGIVGLFV